MCGIDPWWAYDIVDARALAPGIDSFGASNWIN